MIILVLRLILTLRVMYQMMEIMAFLSYNPNSAGLTRVQNLRDPCYSPLNLCTEMWTLL